MRYGIRPPLQRLATRRVVIPAALAALLCVAAFQWRDARLGGLELLDTRQWYTPEQAAALFAALDRLDPRARAVYAWTEVTVDLVFPAAYGLLLALALLRLFGDGRPFYLLPLAGAVADVFENISIALLAAAYAGSPLSWAYMAAVFTLLKSVLILAALAAVVGGVIRWLWVVRRPESFRMHYSYQAVLVLDVLGQRDAVRKTSRVSPEKLGAPGHKGTWAPFQAVATVENIIQQGAQTFENESRRTQGKSGPQYRWQTNRIGDAITVAGILGRSSADDPMVNIRWLVHTLGLVIVTWTKAAEQGIPLRGGLALDTGIARTKHTDCVYGAAWLAALEMEGQAGYLRVAIDASVLDYLAEFEMTVAERFSAADAIEAKRHLNNCRALIATAPDDDVHVVNVCAAPILEAAGLESVKVRRFVERMLKNLQLGVTEKVREKYQLTLRLLDELSDKPILSLPMDITEEEMSDAERSETVSSAGAQAAKAAGLWLAGKVEKIREAVCSVGAHVPIHGAWPARAAGAAVRGRPGESGIRGTSGSRSFGGRTPS